jgi:hypothetical protein
VCASRPVLVLHFRDGESFCFILWRPLSFAMVTYHRIPSQLFLPLTPCLKRLNTPANYSAIPTASLHLFTDLINVC